MNEKLRIPVMLEEGAFYPEKAHAEDAGFDIRVREEVKVAAGGAAVVNTGVHMQIPEGYVGFIKSKSGLNLKHGLRGEGVIDAGYNGPIIVKMYNDSEEDYTFLPGDKLTQVVILPIPVTELYRVDELAESERGDRGFGSSGK